MKKPQTHTQAPQEKNCHFCATNNAEIDYQDRDTLRRYVSSNMKIAPRKRSGLCAIHQRRMAQAIKRARVAGIMQFLPR